MTNSAAGSSDLQKNKSSSSKRKVTVTNDAMTGRNEGSSSGKEMLNMGLQTGTNSGDIEVGQLPATKKPRWVADQKYYYNKKEKLQLFPVLQKSVGELEAECEKLREESRRSKVCMDLQMENNAKWVEEYRSQISSLKYQNEELSKQVNSLIAILLGKNTPMIQPELGSMSQHHPLAIMNQQPSVNMNQLLSDIDQYIDFDQFSNPSGPPQPMQTGGGESEMHNTGNN